MFSFTCLWQYITSTPPNTTQPVSVDIQSLLDHQAFGENANFDGFGGAFEGSLDLTNKQLLVQYTTYGMRQDNIVVDGQSIPLAKDLLGAIYMLVSATNGPLTVPVKVTYQDGSQDTSMLSLPDWKDDHVDHMDRFKVVSFPSNVENVSGALFSVPVYINPSKIPTSIKLPTLRRERNKQVHIFSVTAYRTGKALVSSVETTGEWIDTDTQIIAVRVHNTSPHWIENVNVELTGENTKTTEKGSLEALAPGHHHTVQVIVQHTGEQLETTDVTVIYDAENGHQVTISTPVQLEMQATQDTYEATTASVQRHRSPTWFKQAKFGIFIHWGVYSVPAWGVVGKTYAEWYWYRFNQKDDPAVEYHRQHYGEDFNYDDFLKQWEPTLFDPNAWLDLIDQSGAKYFVFTTKHHDGIALYNTTVTDRSTVGLLSPPRDFVQELMRTSEASFPHLKRGLYFSLPEWYHPSYDLVFDFKHFKGPPVNPYTEKVIPYTGSKPIDDFVKELQVPQLKELVDSYQPDIIWCDIGGPNNSTEWQADYFNQALKSGQQVVVNDRCGDGSASDFTSVEYVAVKNAPSRVWETTRGIDPYSFGYNKETKPEEYASTYVLIETLVDAVSKGGNFLLNIGPEASGHIPEVMSQKLLEMGQWMSQVGPSIHDSIPYWIDHGEKTIRTSANANGKSVYVFYCSQKPTTRIEVNISLPLNADSKVKLMNNPEIPVEWELTNNGGVVLQVDLTAHDLDVMKMPVFEITNHD